MAHDITWSGIDHDITLNFYADITVTRNIQANAASVSITYHCDIPNGMDWAHEGWYEVSGDCTAVSGTYFTMKEMDSGNYGYSGTKTFTVKGLKDGAGNITVKFNFRQTNWYTYWDWIFGSSDKSVKKSYASKTTYAVKYNANGGSDVPASQTKYYGTTLKLSTSTPSRTGYTFNGWNTKADGSGTNYAAGANYTANAAVTLYAKWTAKNYTVTWNGNGGTPSQASRTVAYDSAVGTLPTATRTGYALTGWFTAASSGTQVTASTKPQGNKTYYAQWKATTSDMNPATVTVGGTSAVSASLTWTRHSTSFTHTLTYSFGGLSGTIGTGLTTGATWSLSASLQQQLLSKIPNAASGTGTLTLTTYNGSTKIGTSTAVLTVKAASTVKPVIDSITLSEGTASGFGRYVSPLSTLRAAVSASGIYGSAIKTAVLTYDGTDYSASVSAGEATITTNVLKNSGSSRAVKVTVTDSRGRTVTETRTIDVYAYTAPKFTDIDIEINTDTKLVAVEVTGAIAPVDSQNIKFIKIEKTRVSDSQTTTVLPETALGSYTFEQTVTETVSDIDTESYLYKVTLRDKKGTIEGSKVTGIICISRLAGGKGVRLFGEAYQEGFMVGNIDYTLTDAEYSELLSLLG